MCALRIDRVLIRHVSHVQRMIATSMASRQLRKRGQSIDKKKAKKLKIAYENPDYDTAAMAASSSWAPKNWREQYDNIKKMREKYDAPVDTVGASKLADASALPEVCKVKEICCVTAEVAAKVCTYSSHFILMF